jgi:hypothetical protein
MRKCTDKTEKVHIIPLVASLRIIFKNGKGTINIEITQGDSNVI